MMYELPDFGVHFFEGVGKGKNMVIAVCAKGIQLIDGKDPDRRKVLGDYRFESVAAVECDPEVGGLVGRVVQ